MPIHALSIHPSALSVMACAPQAASPWPEQTPVWRVSPPRQRNKQACQSTYTRNPVTTPPITRTQTRTLGGQRGTRAWNNKTNKNKRANHKTQRQAIQSAPNVLAKSQYDRRCHQPDVFLELPQRQHKLCSYNHAPNVLPTQYACCHLPDVFLG